MNRLAPLLPLLFATTSLLPAQIWTEVGDAGTDLANAQAINGNSALTVIAGYLQGDVDVYLLQIDDPAAFQATSGAGPTDVSLFLLDMQGRGVTGCADLGLFNFNSTLTGINVPGAGRYYLAVAAAGIEPTTPVGDIWYQYFSQHAPEGAGRFEAMTGWAGTSSISGSYALQLTGAAMVGNQLQLPDNHHLSENPSVLGAGGSTAYWQAGGGRFQILYEANHFLSAGVLGQVRIRRLTFRGEDGEVNLGGINWTGATMRIAATSLTASSMTNSFGSNLGPAVTDATSYLNFDVTTTPSAGSTPNSGNLVVDLDGNGLYFTHNPLGNRGNLLIDISLPNAAGIPAGAAMMTMQDTTGTAAVVHGQGLVASSSSATTGTLVAPLVIAVEYGAYTGATTLTTPVLQPARNENYGAACGGSPASFYETFHNGQTFDLVGMTLTPDNVAAPTRYTVARGAGTFTASTLNAAPDSTGDDAVVTRALGFTLNYPGGSTNSISACTNGYIWLNGTTASADFSPTVAELLGASGNQPARLAPCWYDFHCGRNTGIANSGLHVRTTGTAGNSVCYVTWRQVGVFNQIAQSGTVAYDVQCVIHEATGVIEYRYGKVPRHCANATVTVDTVAALVGFSRGWYSSHASADPQTRDLSIETPFTTGNDAVGNIGLKCITGAPSSNAPYGGRLFQGQQAYWRADNLPAGTLVGVQLLSLGSSRPGLQLPTITAAGCVLSTSTDAVLWEVHALPGSSVTTTAALNVPTGVEGAQLHAQYVVLGGLFGAPDLITSASHAVKQTVGKQ